VWIVSGAMMSLRLRGTCNSIHQEVIIGKARMIHGRKREVGVRWIFLGGVWDGKCDDLSKYDKYGVWDFREAFWIIGEMFDYNDRPKTQNL
jgi:hypothetical protein